MDRDQIVIDLLKDGADINTIMDESGYKKSKIYDIKKNQTKVINNVQSSTKAIQRNTELIETNNYGWITNFMNFINKHSTIILIGTGFVLLILIIVVICLILGERAKTKQLHDDVNESVKALTNAKLKAEEERDEAIREKDEVIREKNEIAKIKDEEIKKRDDLIKKVTSSSGWNKYPVDEINDNVEL